MLYSCNRRSADFNHWGEKASRWDARFNYRGATGITS